MWHYLTFIPILSLNLCMYTNNFQKRFQSSKKMSIKSGQHVHTTGFRAQMTKIIAGNLFKINFVQRFVQQPCPVYTCAVCIVPYLFIRWPVRSCLMSSVGSCPRTKCQQRPQRIRVESRPKQGKVKSLPAKQCSVTYSDL